MDLSIVIITLNNKNILEECIDSIKQFTKDISYEIIVTDNGSTDGTAEMVRAKHPDVIIIENGKNLGFSAANNKGLKISKGRYWLLLNDDTYLKENAFLRVVKFMDNDPKITVCGPKLLNIDGSIQHQGSIFTQSKWLSKEPIEVDFVLGACLFMRASAMDKIGLLDENLFFYNDDLDLCKRTKYCGGKVIYFPGAEVYHYGGFSSKKSPDKMFMVEGFRGGLYYCKKHYGELAYQSYRVLLLLAMPIFALFSLANKEKRSAFIDIFDIALKQQLFHSR